MTDVKMYFYNLNSIQNEQTELLEMRRAFGILVCPFSITLFVNNISQLFGMRSIIAPHFLFNQLHPLWKRQE
jgi:hypothetical protein